MIEQDPIVVREPERLRARCDAARARGLTVGFVPTMGALHEGHLALLAEARRRAGFVVCSVFVNPTQFGPNEDYARYPRDLDADVKKLEGVDLVFAPEPSTMYLAGERTRVRVDGLTAHLCGPFRPGHFEGVTTVVTKLFALVGRCTAVFGRKDYQQLAVLRRMAADLFLPVEIVGYPMVRERDGLARSSRNAYLSPDERVRALGLSRGLSAAARAFGSGERSAGALRRLARAEVDGIATSVDYVTVADVDTLEPIDDAAAVADRALVAIACRVGVTRLIDNVVLGEDPAPSPSSTPAAAQG
jgi:pantoate--beta-alanine ligase